MVMTLLKQMFISLTDAYLAPSAAASCSGLLRPTSAYAAWFQGIPLLPDCGIAGLPDCGWIEFNSVNQNW